MQQQKYRLYCQHTEGHVWQFRFAKHEIECFVLLKFLNLFLVFSLNLLINNIFKVFFISLSWLPINPVCMYAEIRHKTSEVYFKIILIDIVRNDELMSLHVVEITYKCVDQLYMGWTQSENNDQWSQCVDRNGIYLWTKTVKFQRQEKSYPKFRKSWKVEKTGFKISRLSSFKILRIQ